LYRYEVGYDQSGNQVAAQRYAPGDTLDDGSPSDAINIALAGAVVTERDAAGTVIVPEESPEKIVTDEFAVGLVSLKWRTAFGEPFLVRGLARLSDPQERVHAASDVGAWT